MERDKLREEIGRDLTRLNRSKVLNKVTEYLEGEDAALNILMNHPNGLMPSIISKRLGVSRARITNIINSLYKKEYVKVENVENDRRKVNIVITFKGETYITQSHNEKIEFFNYLYEKLGEENILMMARLIKTTADTFEKLEEEVNKGFK